MSQTAPPAYSWTVALSDGSRFLVDAAVRAYLARKYAFTRRQVDGLTPENVELLLAAESSEESE